MNTKKELSLTIVNYPPDATLEFLKILRLTLKKNSSFCMTIHTLVIRKARPMLSTSYQGVVLEELYTKLKELGCRVQLKEIA